MKTESEAGDTPVTGEGNAHRGQNQVMAAMPIDQRVAILRDLIREAKANQPVGWKGNVKRIEKEIKHLEGKH